MRVFNFNNFSKKLKDALNEQNITMTELASKIGKTKASINDYIKGHSLPTLQIYFKICDILDIPFDIVVEKEENEEKEYSKNRVLTEEQNEKQDVINNQFINNTFKDRLKTLVSNDQIEDVLREMKKHISKEYENDLYLLLARNNDLVTEYRRGTLKFEEYSQFKQKVNFQIFSIIDKI